MNMHTSNELNKHTNKKQTSVLQFSFHLAFVLPQQLLTPEMAEFIILRYTLASHPVNRTHAVFLVLMGNIQTIGIQLKMTFTMMYLSAMLPHTLCPVVCQFRSSSI